MKSDIVYFENIRDAIERIERHRKVDSEETSYAAILYDLTIIGEAASKISKEARVRYPDIPWRKIIGTHNVIVHDCLGIREETIWDIVKNKLPPLLIQIENAIKDTEKNHG